MGDETPRTRLGHSHGLSLKTEKAPHHFLKSFLIDAKDRITQPIPKFSLPCLQPGLNRFLGSRSRQPHVELPRASQ